jgi:hypothetical protein
VPPANFLEVMRIMRSGRRDIWAAETIGLLLKD